jgi:integrase
MAKRPVSRSKKPKRQLDHIDPKRALDLDEFAKLKAWALATLANKRARTDRVWAANTTVGVASGPSALTIRNAAIVLTMLGTGARRFELCAFRCGAFYKVDSEPRVRFDEAKGNVEAEVAISDETWQAIQDWLVFKGVVGEPDAPNSPLFCGRNGEHLSRAQLNNIWNATIQIAGLTKREGVSCHASRHAAGLLLLRATNSMSQTARFLRHANERITERFYKHVLPSDIRAGLVKAGM